MNAPDLTQQHLVDPAWVIDHLDHPNLRIIDATVFLDPQTWQSVSGREVWEAGHIPGSTFADLMEEFSDPAGDVELPPKVRGYRVPSPTAFADAIGAHGVGPDTAVVTYDSIAGMWSARLWWMLRYFGHENVAVLDGGWQSWISADGPVTTEAVTPARTDFTARPNPALIATLDQVAAAVDTEEDSDPAPLLVHAMWPALFIGEDQGPVARPGRIPGSVNVPFLAMLNETGRLLPPDRIREIFGAAGVTGDAPVRTYCVAGIASSFDTLALATIGIDAALYDGSLIEWVADPSRPLQTG